MKQVHIQAKPFFEMLKLKEQSMWDVFAELIDGKEKDLIFLDENKVLFNFILPKTLVELEQQKTDFADLFKKRVQAFLN